MSERAQGGIKTALVAALLLLQIVLGGLATNGAWEISVWCTAPASSPWSLVFALVHGILLGLLIFGLFSLRFVRLRLPLLHWSLPRCLRFHFKRFSSCKERYGATLRNRPRAGLRSFASQPKRRIGGGKLTSLRR